MKERIRVFFILKTKTCNEIITHSNHSKRLERKRGIYKKKEIIMKSTPLNNNQTLIHTLLQQEHFKVINIQKMTKVN